MDVTPQRLQLWLECLLAAAAGLNMRGAALVGRDRHRFRVLERYELPASALAEELLEQLQGWRDAHRMDCWGLPPETGWAFASAESSKPGLGRGWAKAKDAWEGGYQQRAEREDPVQRVCFGSDLPGFTLFVLRLSEWVQSWWFILLLCFFCVFLLRRCSFFRCGFLPCCSLLFYLYFFNFFFFQFPFFFFLFIIFFQLFFIASFCSTCGTTFRFTGFISKCYSTFYTNSYFLFFLFFLRFLISQIDITSFTPT
jgi:hypothetical protein